MAIPSQPSMSVSRKRSVHAELHYPASASIEGTVTILMGLFLAYSLAAGAESPSVMAGTTATTIGIALAVSIYFDSRRGLRNLLRTDLLSLIGLYFLTLAEFLFPQAEFNDLLTLEQTSAGLSITLIGMGALALGRHLIPPKPMQSGWLRFSDISNQLLFRVFVGVALLGYLNMLLSVDFNVVAMIDAMLEPRFSQPWGRGRLGGINSLISELALLLYIIPPLTGVIWNRRKFFSGFKLIVVLAVFSLTLFQGFAGGTRNVFIAYLATFIIGYLLTLPRNNFRNTVIPLLITGFIAVYGSYHMLEFRTMGLRNYVQNQVYAGDTVRETLSVDYNLYSLGLVVDSFPENHDYLGLEVLSWSIIKPIPRFFWPGKPEGLSASIEEIVGAEGYTVSATYLGEAYMMGGHWGVISMSLFFGAVAAWWNRLAFQRRSGYAMLVYALGFFVAALTMRSMFWFTTAMLPIIALIVFKKFAKSY